MEYNKQQECRIKIAVSEYMVKNNHLIPMHLIADPDALEHITNIGTNIVMNNWGINTQPGSFVQAVLDNDLEASVNRADEVNRQMLPFYVTLKFNLGYVE
jgi:hypothetical protein